MRLIELCSITLIILFSIFINFYFGHQGLMPLDDLQNFNSGFRVANGDFPFRDYFSITGPLLDIWQSNIYQIFGFNWQGFVLHASLMNCLYSISIYFFLKNLNFTILESFFYSISGATLMYPPAGNPTVEHNSLILNITAFLLFIVGLQKKNNFLLFFSIFVFGLAFFTKQVPTAYFLIFCTVIYFSQVFRKVEFLNFLFLALSVILIFSSIISYFLYNQVSLKNIYDQYFVFASSLGEDRFTNINFTIIYENISKLFFLLFILIPSFYLFYLKKNFENLILLVGLSILMVIYEIHSQNQPITFSLLPIFLSLFYYSYTKEKIGSLFIRNFFYLLIIYTFYRILRFDLIYLGIFFIIILSQIFLIKKNISFKHIILVYLFISSSLYFEKYVKIRAWDDLNKNDLNNSFNAEIIDHKLKSLKWKTVNFKDSDKEKKFILETLNYLKSLDPSINYLLISDYQIFNLILNKKDFSPVKYWFKDHTYPNIDHPLRKNFDLFFKEKINKNNISLLIFDNTAQFKSLELKEFDWLYKCLQKKQNLLSANNLDVFQINSNCLL